MGITVVGLGPGDGRHLTREAWEILSSAKDIYLRTERHPAVADLPGSVNPHSFDHIYQSAVDFSDVYRQIVDTLIRLSREGDIIYAVPGHPLVGESTVTELIREAAFNQQPLRVVAGLSFVEPVLTTLGIDALDGLQIYDALQLAERHYPSLNANVPVLLGQVYSRLIASEVKLTLNSVYPDEHPVCLVHQAGESDAMTEMLSLYEIDRSDQIGHLTSLYIPALPSASTLPALAETVAVLRSPEGCPWDIEQTPQSMRDSFMEEAYEVLEAIDARDPDNLREELGDMLYHIVMQAQMASEAGDFTLSEVISGIEAKLRRRHPHVWGDWQVDSTEEVLRNWDQLKRNEKKSSRQSLLDGIVTALPALLRSQEIQSRVGKVGFDWSNIAGVFEKIQEEIAELQLAEGAEEIEEEVGDLFFSLVNLARWYGVHAESALREANLRFEERFRVIESLVEQREADLAKMSLDEMESLWEEAKEMLAKAASSD